jgi:hypothetical protein
MFGHLANPEETTWDANQVERHNLQRPVSTERRFQIPACIRRNETFERKILKGRAPQLKKAGLRRYQQYWRRGPRRLVDIGPTQRPPLGGTRIAAAIRMPVFAYSAASRFTRPANCFLNLVTLGATMTWQ